MNNSGVEDRLDYLVQTKNLMKLTINNLGGTITNSTTFREYPSQIQNVINTTIISQAVVDNLANNIININGEVV